MAWCTPASSVMLGGIVVGAREPGLLVGVAQRHQQDPGCDDAPGEGPHLRLQHLGPRELHERHHGVPAIAGALSQSELRERKGGHASCVGPGGANSQAQRQACGASSLPNPNRCRSAQLGGVRAALYGHGRVRRNHHRVRCNGSALCAQQPPGAPAPPSCKPACRNTPNRLMGAARSSHHSHRSPPTTESLLEPSYRGQEHLCCQRSGRPAGEIHGTTWQSKGDREISDQ